NPIPDFLQHSEYVFLTADSSSMISEAVSFGKSCVEVLPFTMTFPEKSKFNKFLKTLIQNNSLHLFNGQVGYVAEKVDLVNLLKGVRL
ncbi:MAG: mitochondrial fission ELM1 family protein, partial [Desulfobulbaceae bacterium]|nr:mitochondrial fission ELM1 family protein [Desulfobulbaceae bacterium]